MLRRLAIALCVLAFCATPSVLEASPVLIGQFFLSIDPVLGPTFYVENDSSATTPETFANLQLWLDVNNGTGGVTPDEFALASALAPGDPTVDSNGLVDPTTGNSLLPDLSTVQSAWIAFSVADPGTVLLTGQPSCAGCTDTMTSLIDGSTLSIYFDPSTPTSVPEPSTMVLFGSGLLVAALVKRKAVGRQ